MSTDDSRKATTSAATIAAAIARVVASVTGDSDIPWIELWLAKTISYGRELARGVVTGLGEAINVLGEASGAGVQDPRLDVLRDQRAVWRMIEAAYLRALPDGADFDLFSGIRERARLAVAQEYPELTDKAAAELRIREVYEQALLAAADAADDAAELAAAQRQPGDGDRH